MKNRTLYVNGLLSLCSFWLVLFAVSPAQAQPVKLVNRWKNETIGIANGKPVSTATDNDTWLIEKTGEDNFVRLKNTTTGTYLHNQNGPLEAGSIQPGWWSAQWTMNAVDGYFHIVNRWKGTYLHNQNGPLELGVLGDPGWWSAQWAIKEDNSTASNNIGDPNLQAAALEDTIYEDIPEMSQEDITKIMNWLKVKVIAEKLPFCWRQSYGRGAGEIAGACPPGTEKDGALCYPLPQKGYKGVGPVCWQSCPSGFRDDGAFCAKPAAYGRGSGYAAWNEEKCKNENPTLGCEKNGAMWYPKCQQGFVAVGCCICSPQCPPDFGTDIGVSCTKKTYTRGAGTILECPPGLIRDETGGPAGLCYPKCRPGFHGVGPVCWQDCDPNWVGCAAACSKTSTDCGFASFEQVLSVATVAANIAILVLTGPGGAEAATLLEKGGTELVKVGVTSAKAGTSVAAGSGYLVTAKAAGILAKAKIGEAFMKAVTLLQNVKPSNLEKGASVVRRIYQARTGTKLSQSITTFKVVKAGYTALTDYRKAFADNFIEQTSIAINQEIDDNFTPKTARYLKEYWATIQIKEVAEANNWQIAQTTMAVASIIDITGVTGLVAAFAKPICQDAVAFPKLSQSYK